MSTTEGRHWPQVNLRGPSLPLRALVAFALAMFGFFAMGPWFAPVLWSPIFLMNYAVLRAARRSSIESDGGGELVLVVQDIRWWREPRRVVLRPGEYGIMAHGVGWTIVDYDVMQLRIFATGERLPLNSFYFRRREWLPVRDAIVANEKPPPPGRRHW